MSVEQSRGIPISCKCRNVAGGGVRSPSTPCEWRGGSLDDRNGYAPLSMNQPDFFQHRGTEDTESHREERGSATRSNFARQDADKTNGSTFDFGACCGSQSRAPAHALFSNTPERRLAAGLNRCMSTIRLRSKSNRAGHRQPISRQPAGAPVQGCDSRPIVGGFPSPHPIPLPRWGRGCPTCRAEAARRRKGG